ncbi:MAG TPA: Wadjet anti-phage system protein JetD domain-containing protein [Verrucomicrobiales bacterium]|jgi:hypothetical protein|nr:Wadjet anti-phage system protein JetD domain-containing protein [Verrucomicrobiales bacterium]
MNPPLISRTILEVLANRYKSRRAGRTGKSANRILFDYQEVLKAGNCTDGETLDKAEQQLLQSHHHGWIKLIAHPRDPGLIQQIEFLPAGEAPLFAALSSKSPAQRREEWKTIFLSAALHSVSDKWSAPWTQWCSALADLSLSGEVRAPFQWREPEEGAELLRVMAAVLSWEGESLIRFVSCVVCGDSKRLEQMRLRLETGLVRMSEGSLTTLEQLGILQNRRGVLLHGPLLLQFATGSLDLNLLSAPVRISNTDIASASAVSTSARRCLTVENETTMQELAKQRSGTLLIHTSYPSDAVLALMALLPDDIEYRHFGDTDPAGFDILRDLRARTGRNILPLHMQIRPSPDGPSLSADERRMLGRLLEDPLLTDVRPQLETLKSSGSKGMFEQESLGLPARDWPFYPEERKG